MICQICDISDYPNVKRNTTLPGDCVSARCDDAKSTAKARKTNQDYSESEKQVRRGDTLVRLLFIVGPCCCWTQSVERYTMTHEMGSLSVNQLSTDVATRIYCDAKGVIDDNSRFGPTNYTCSKY